MAISIVAAVGGLALVAVVLLDAFETIVLPRRVTRRTRITVIFYTVTWALWSAFGRRLHGRPRESYLSYYGPLSLLLLLVCWASLLLLGFALLQRSLGSGLQASGGPAGFGQDLYMSGTTFFTLGLGDVVPRTAPSRILTVLEVGTGLGFLALVIGYVPVLYQAFSRREVYISMLDERAGSPPIAVELLRRYGQPENAEGVNQFLRNWETWAAELMESHLSYPGLAYYRSQHDNQSWIAALTMILDLSALVTVGIDGLARRPGRLAYAMTRHAAADLCQVFAVHPHDHDIDRLPDTDLPRLHTLLNEAGVHLYNGEDAGARLRSLRQDYEPYVHALADYFLMPLPAWLPPAHPRDNWQWTAWERESGTQLYER